MVRKMGFPRFLRDTKTNKIHIWAFVGDDPALLDMGSQRLIKALGLPVQKLTGKVNPMSVGHAMGELEMITNQWVLVLDDVKKIDKLDFFNKMVVDTIGENYLILIANEKVLEEVLEWVGTTGRVVNCDKIESRKDLLDILERIFADANIRLASHAGQAVLNL